MKFDEYIEDKIAAKHPVGPRLKSDDIESKIEKEAYHVFEGTTTTVCLLTLENGYAVVGTSAAVSIENFDAEIGRSVAREDAKSKIWSLEGYLLKERISKAPKW